LTPDKEIFKVVAGDYVEAQREGVKFGKMLYGKEVDTKCDIAIVSSFPVDIDFWQATKGVLCGDHILKDGGTLILVTPCYEGVGPHKEYINQIGNDNAESLLKMAEKGENIKGDPLALAIGTTISRIRKRIKLILVSNGITEREAHIAQFDYYYSAQEAIDAAVKLYDNPKASVITHGGEQFLYPRQQNENYN
jgi:nickel-dependent lactate racemase